MVMKITKSLVSVFLISKAGSLTFLPKGYRLGHEILHMRSDNAVFIPSLAKPELNLWCIFRGVGGGGDKNKQKL